MIKYPQVEVKLIGRDGNAFSVLGVVQGALRKAGVSKAERDQFLSEATAGNYDHLLKTCMEWVNIT